MEEPINLQCIRCDVVNMSAMNIYSLLKNCLFQETSITKLKKFILFSILPTTLSIPFKNLPTGNLKGSILSISFVVRYG